MRRRRTTTTRNPYAPVGVSQAGVVAAATAPSASTFAVVAIFLVMVGTLGISSTATTYSGIVMGQNAPQDAKIAALQAQHMALMAADIVLCGAMTAEETARVAGDAEIQGQIDAHELNITAIGAKNMALMAVDTSLQIQTNASLAAAVMLSNETAGLTIILVEVITVACALKPRVVAIEANATANAVSVITQGLEVSDHEARITALENTVSGPGGTITLLDSTTAAPGTGVGFTTCVNFIATSSNPDTMVVSGSGATVVNSGLYTAIVQTLDGITGADVIGVALTVNGIRVKTSRFDFASATPIYATQLVDQVNLGAGDLVGAQMWLDSPFGATALQVELTLSKVL